MRVCGQEFSTPILDRIRGAITDDPNLSRRALSRRVCEWLNWRSSHDRFQEGNCRKALAQLHRRGLLNLPQRERHDAFGHPRQQPHTFGKERPVEIACALEQLGPITVVPVTSRYGKDFRLYCALLDTYHYLGNGRLVGAQMRYVIQSESYGPLGALAFSSASWALQARDRFIGWSDAQRIAHLQYVLTNDRFLIVPTVHVPNLASHVMALALRQLPTDWEARYHLRPVLVETFVDPTRFDGTCYKASNWIDVGQTAGRRDGNRKRVFLYPLAADWRTILCQPCEIPLGEAPRLNTEGDWAEHEFSTMRVQDPRLKERLYAIARDFYNRPQARIPEACGSKARSMGAYRFFQNKKVSMNVILTPHTEATIDRIKAHKVVLAPQDTTTLNYGTHPATMGLGPINNKANTSMGLILHDTVAFTEEGTPLGVLDAQCWARDPEDRGKRDRRKTLPIEQKESMKWLRSYQKVAQIQKLCPETTLVSIGDREADLYEFFLEASRQPKGPKLLVRAAAGRNRQVEQERLWSYMSGLAGAGVLQIHLPRRGNKKGRTAQVTIRFSPVQIRPPRGKTGPLLSVWAIYLTEIDRPEETDSIEWMLLTTEAVDDFADAQRCVGWYSRRWGMEVYHRTLKSGCRIKDRHLGTADRLESCLGVDMVVAWRIYHLTMLGREVPDHPCTVFFEEVEWKALCCYDAKKATPPKTPPTLNQAIRMLGKMGGHLGRKGDGMPGAECLWRGLQRLDVAVDMYVVFKHESLPEIRRSYPYALLPQRAGP